VKEALFFPISWGKIHNSGDKIMKYRNWILEPGTTISGIADN
jgi:hypothetical protein